MEVQWIEMLDSAQMHYRAARIVDGHLSAVLFIAPEHRLPPRDWLARLFAKDHLDSAERARVLAGTPGKGEEDGGPVVCSCFGVGRNTLCKAVAEQGLNTPEAIGEALEAGTNCGSCVPEIRDLISQTRRSDAA